MTAAGSGTPLQGVAVHAYSPATSSSVGAWTDGDGLFSFSALAAGSYYLLTSNSPGYVEELFDNVPCSLERCNPTREGTPILVIPGGAVSSIEIALAVGGSISGRVTDESGGAGIAGVTVKVWRRGASLATEVAETTTAVDGSYVVAGLGAAGHFLAALPATGYVVGGGSISSVDFALTRGGRIRGRVATGGDAPVAAAVVTLYRSASGVLDRVARVETQVGGHYEHAGLPDGQDRLLVSADGFITRPYGGPSCAAEPCDPASDSLVTLAAGQTLETVDLTLDRATAASNDAIARAMDITVGSGTPFTATLDTTGSSPLLQGVTSSCVQNVSLIKPAWFRYSASSGGSLTLDTHGSTYDTVLMAFRGAPGSLVALDGARSDDDAGLATSRIDVTTKAGETYYFAVAHRADLVSTTLANGGTLVFHAALGCATALAPEESTMGPSGGQRTLAVSGPAGCPWSVAPSVPWLEVTGAARGRGNGTVGVSVAPGTRIQ